MFAPLASFLLPAVLASAAVVAGSQHPQCGVNARLEKNNRFIVESDEENPPGSWPWTCSVGFGNATDWEHQCGAVIVGSGQLVTAAHCPITFEAWGKADRVR